MIHRFEVHTKEPETFRAALWEKFGGENIQTTLTDKGLIVLIVSDNSKNSLNLQLRKLGNVFIPSQR